MRHRVGGFAVAMTLAMIPAMTLGPSGTTLAAHDTSSLYRIDLATGEATVVGKVGGAAELVGLAAVTIDDDTWLYGVSTTNQLIAFTPDMPGSLTVNLPLSGLAPGVEIVGIDVRPATGGLYGIGDDGVVYLIDVTTGAAAAVGPAIDPSIEGTMVGFDFNPTVDRIRLTSNAGQNLRLNPETGAIGANPDTGAPTIDGEIAWAEGDANSGGIAVVGSAYTNNVAGATETQLYVIDDAKDVLGLQNPPNDGIVNTVGELGIDVSQVVGFDITPDGVGYFVATAVD